jgi:hypothetical protein
MLEKLRAILDENELGIVSPIFKIIESDLCQEQSFVEERGEYVACKVVSRGDLKCQFEIHFGRKTHRGNMSWSIGLGAEVCENEHFDNIEDVRDLKGDVERILKSVVRCEMYIAKGKIRKALYFPSLWVFGGKEGSFAYVADYLWPFVKTKKIVKYYEPWI